MAPDAPDSPRDGHGSSAWQQRRASESIALSQSRRNDGQWPFVARSWSQDHDEVKLTIAESWVEIASQPSSSSLSSIGDEIVTTGLRVGGQSLQQRRRRLYQQNHQQHHSTQIPRSSYPAETSSQEEYDETESEEDRVMGSSAENISRPSLPAQATAIRSAAMTDSSDDDDRATALGRPSSSSTFRPQPNAFSHPPSHLQHRHSTPSSTPHHQAFHGRRSSSPRRHNFVSPREDNDAALRASLTTLLSCAAAARGLGRKEEAGAAAGPSRVMPGNQPMEMRLVPESELLAPPPPVPAPVRTASNSSAPSGPDSATSPRETSKQRRAAGVTNSSPATSRPARPAGTRRRQSQQQRADEAGAAFLSPTLLAWVVGAGVVVLVSVVGFGAGFVIGRETGYQEGVAAAAAGANATAGAACGREIVRGSGGGGTLRRFRWGAGMAKSVAA
jgi:hypothetical protein